MAAQQTKGTGPELALRTALHQRGLRYRLHRAPLPSLRRTADIVFGPARVAVFVDGCFWHGCPEHGKRQYKVNDWYWPEKIERNRQRDADTDARLREASWLPIRVWEHEDPSKAAARIAGEVRRRRPTDRRAGLPSKV
jgi:DNA mismatch endonuclease (patch repair protein)